MREKSVAAVTIIAIVFLALAFFQVRSSAYTSTGNLPLTVEPVGSSWGTVYSDAISQSSNNGHPNAGSTYAPDEQIFEGNFTPDYTTSLAILSDDGADVYVNGSKVWSGKGQPQDLSTLSQSLHTVSVTLQAGTVYNIKIDYTNTIYTGSYDIDGCTLFAYPSPTQGDRGFKITAMNIVKVDGQTTPSGWNGRLFKASNGNRSVTVRATIDTATAGQTVYWSYVDPAQDLNTTPAPTNSTGNDNKGSGAGFGGSATATSTTDAPGTATITFSASGYGGDNYQVKAANDAAADQTMTTQNFTVWKRIIFEGVEALSGRSVDPADLDTLLGQVFVERDTTQGTAKTIPATDRYLTNGGAYGPTLANGDVFAAEYDSPDPTNPLSGLRDWQVLCVRAEAANANEISNTAKEPYSSSTTYNFGKIIAADGGTVINYSNQGDLSLTELNSVSNYTAPSNYYIMFYDDCTIVESMMFGVSAPDRRQRSLWHEVGHALGLQHSDAGTDTTSIMTQMPSVSAQADVYTSRTLVTKMHWGDNAASTVRQNYGG